jgi:pyruvate dehydrogenase E1 component alpha subunit
MTSQLKKEDLLRAYRTMREIREFEDRLHIEFATGKIPGFVHLYSGEEAVATGVCMHLTDEDRISSTHRGHGHCIAKGVDIHGMMAEIYGKKTGTCGGKGGSMHIADLAKGMMGANGIVGAGPPLICGAALAAKFKGTGGVGVAFFGDGASNQGTILESMNLASVWKLPVIFLNENNGYAESTGVSYNVPTPNIADRAAGFGMPGVTVDGNDFFAVYEAAGEAIRRARAGEGPTLLECKTQRYFGHFEGDAMTYRPNGESQNLRKTKDCLKIFAEKAIAAGLVTAAELEAIDKEVLALIEDSVVKALAAPKPTAADLLTGVYVSY